MKTLTPAQRRMLQTAHDTRGGGVRVRGSSEVRTARKLALAGLLRVPSFVHDDVFDARLFEITADGRTALGSKQK